MKRSHDVDDGISLLLFIQSFFALNEDEHDQV